MEKEKIKVKRQRATSKADSQSQDKPIKIKLTTKENGTTITGAGHSASEDEDEPEAAIEEQMILRLPEGELAERLREYVRKREIPEDVKLHFKDSRRGTFTLDGKRYTTTLVDLPTILESQKTFDKKQFYKIADISQMLLVEDASGEDTFLHSNAKLNSTDPYAFQHGITPPLKHVRKRRFRKKLSKRAIEEVEKEVERLLEVDATAEDVQYDVYDNREMEMEAEQENQSDAGTQDIEIDESEMGDSESDEDLVAAISRDWEELEEEDNDDDDEEEEGEEDDSEDDDDDNENKGEIEQKRQEIAEIKQAIQRKTRDVLTAPNEMLKKRFETNVEKLKNELALKEAHLAEMNKYFNSSTNS